jgi:hypothetical protein
MAERAYNVIQSISGQIMSEIYLNLIENTVNKKK